MSSLITSVSSACFLAQPWKLLVYSAIFHCNAELYFMKAPAYRLGSNLNSKINPTHTPIYKQSCRSYFAVKLGPLGT